MTAVHRVAKTAGRGDGLPREETMLLLRRIDQALQQDSGQLNDRALTTLAWSLGRIYADISEMQTRSGDRSRRLGVRAEREVLAEQVRETLGLILEQLKARDVTRLPPQVSLSPPTSPPTPSLSVWCMRLSLCVCVYLCVCISLSVCVCVCLCVCVQHWCSSRLWHKAFQVTRLPLFLHFRACRPWRGRVPSAACIKPTVRKHTSSSLALTSWP